VHNQLLLDGMSGLRDQELAHGIYTDPDKHRRHRQNLLFIWQIGNRWKTVTKTQRGACFNIAGKTIAQLSRTQHLTVWPLLVPQ
jgi:hypothetical protein